jgi:L-alanine-DL-glutamate epimerase-like enolase superfamily enzyme
MPIASIHIQPCIQRMSDTEWKFARAAIPEVRGVILSLTDENGCTGLGYAQASAFTGATIDSVTTLLDAMTPMLAGGNPLHTQALLAMVNARFPGHPNEAGCIDMALHDLAARRLGVPIHVLLGGKQRDVLQVSRLLSLKAPVQMAEVASRLVAQGYRALKVKLNGEIDLDVERVAAVRSAVGPAMTLTLDANEAYSAETLLAAFARMEPYDIALIEQPVPRKDWAGLKKLTDGLPAAIEADESADSLASITRLVQEHVVDSINLRIGRLGGFANFVTAARICEQGGVSYRMGTVFGPSLVPAMIAQAASALNQMTFACELGEHLHFLDDPFTPFPIEAGCVKVSDLPGCGVELLETPPA